MGGWDGAIGDFFAEFFVEECIVETGTGGICGATAKVDGVDTSPIDGGEAERAGLAAGVKLASVKRKGIQGPTRGADGIYLGVGCGIIGCRDGVGALADDASFLNDDSSKRPSAGSSDVFRSQRNGAPEELRIWGSGCGQLANPSLCSQSKHSMAQAIRSTRVVTPHGVAPATILVEGEKIAAVGGWDEAQGNAPLYDFGNAVLLPGLVDTHVHINEPGRTEWEGFETATRAAAAGGVTTLVDMPLNCIPETADAEALDAKRTAARGKAWVDWAAWGGVVRGNADSLPGLVEAGVPGFKCFLIDSGVPGFAWVDEPELRLAFEQLRGTGLPLLVHAEAPGPIAERAEEWKSKIRPGWRDYRTYLLSRPDIAESDAIALLYRMAEEYRTAIHVVHLSSAGPALTLLKGARRDGLPVTVETCPHYLWFAAEDVPDGATEFKCAPPIRSAENREKLWKALEEGHIDMVVTDHSPCPPEMKHRDSGYFDKAWGGIASLGLALPVMWTSMRERGLGIERIGNWMAAAPARLAGLESRKGSIATGFDADLVVFDPEIEWTVTTEDLHFRHKLSPYLGARLRGRVMETWLRGEPVYKASGFFGSPKGKEWTRQ